MHQTTIIAGGDLGVNLDSFARHLRAENLSPKTQKTYSEACGLFHRFLAERGMPLNVAAIKREHVEAFITDQVTRWKPATALNRYRGVQTLFKWLLEEGEVKASPMVNMKPPRVPETPPPVLKADQLKALMATCESGKTLRDRRDAAILRVMIDTGARREEIAGLHVTASEDAPGWIDLESGTVVVTGKGHRVRMLKIGAKAVRALDRYLRVRATHPRAALPWLWLGHRGRYAETGVFETVRQRGLQAGLGPIYPHQLRHSFAHRWLAANGPETDLMALTGWRSRTMLQRYAASTAVERAHAAHTRLGLGDEI